MSRLTHWGKWNDISMNTVKINQVNCQTCNDPTKYITGFWDGKNGASGVICDCRNYKCEIKQENIERALAIESKIIAVAEENSRNNIFMELIKSRRKSLLINIMKMSKALGISPSDYSNYEMCRVALPVEMVERIEDVFRNISRSRLIEVKTKSRLF